MIHVHRKLLANQFLCWGLALLVLATRCFSQTPQKEPAFEVASVKALAPADGNPFGLPFNPLPPNPLMERRAFQGGPGTTDPGRIRYSTTLKMLLWRAYSVRREQISGPAWMDEQRYEIIANVPSGADDEQVRHMLRSLLAERFELQLRREKKTVSVYALVVAKGGPKLQPGKETPPLPTDPAERAAALEQRRNEAVTRLGARGGAGNYPARRVNLPNNSLDEFIANITPDLDRPTFDRTGLKGNFSFDLWFAHEQPGWQGELPPGELIFDVVKRDLGLEFQPRKEEMEMLVIDHARRFPTAN
jgi:uncharacterized protein (TIGR03435 family)